MAVFQTHTFSKYDDWMTPRDAWENINHLIPKNKVIWEPFYGDGTSGEYLREMGHTVIHRDIDFFNNDEGEIIVTNPPFTLKKQVLQRLKLLNKPFILLCPISMVSTAYYRELFSESCQLILPRRRIQFIKKNDDGEMVSDGRCNFDCAYFCHRIDLANDIIFL
tara:strand:- start:2097 stop:2588 length:492 start_codon:yes stop_codon:yes gene_type:complete